MLYEVITDWGDGSVELVQIPSDNENNDNLVAYWRPAKLPETGKPFAWNYRIYWGENFKDVPPEGYVTSTHIGRDMDGKSRVFVLDFEGPKLNKLPEGAPIQASVSVAQGATVTEQKLDVITSYSIHYTKLYDADILLKTNARSPGNSRIHVEMA